MNRRNFIQQTAVGAVALALPLAKVNGVSDQGIYMDTTEERNQDSAHIVGIEYTGPEGRFWVGASIKGFGWDETEKFREMLRPELMGMLQKEIEQRRKTGAFS